eukprot:470812_1
MALTYIDELIDTFDNVQQSTFINVTNCPGNHGLTSFMTNLDETLTINTDYYCDGCDELIAGRNDIKEVWGCNICDYDLCIECLDIPSLYMELLQTSAEYREPMLLLLSEILSNVVIFPNTIKFQ